MAITEENRHRLHQRLDEVLGQEQATTLMEHLPPVGWADVATRHDLQHHAQVTERDLALVRREMASEFALVRTEMASEFALVRTEMASEFALVRTEMATGFGAVDQRFDRFANELRAEWRGEQRNLALAILGANTTLAALAFAAARLL